MEIRPAITSDLAGLNEIDGTIESAHYLHVERTGEGLAMQWRIEERPLRQKLIDRNRIAGDEEFLLKHVVTGIDEGLVLVAEHDNIHVAQLLAQPQPAYATMKVMDLRIDFDYRRQGLATAMLYQAIADARARELRALSAECQTNNIAANRLFEKLGFELAGLDTLRRTNHDLVKESATLFWYMALD